MKDLFDWRVALGIVVVCSIIGFGRGCNLPNINIDNTYTEAGTSNRTTETTREELIFPSESLCTAQVSIGRDLCSLGLALLKQEDDKAAELKKLIAGEASELSVSLQPQTNNIKTIEDWTKAEPVWAQQILGNAARMDLPLAEYQAYAAAEEAQKYRSSGGYYSPYYRRENNDNVAFHQRLFLIGHNSGLLYLRNEISYLIDPKGKLESKDYEQNQASVRAITKLLQESKSFEQIFDKYHSLSSHLSDFQTALTTEAAHRAAASAADWPEHLMESSIFHSKY